jgi:putative transcriptional regulator
MRRAALWLLLIVGLAPALVTRAAPEDGTPAVAINVTGELLVAAPGIGDSRFEGTVIYVIHHDKDGAFGVAINRPVAPRPFAQLLAELGQDGAGVTGTARLFAGGPVQPDIGFILHTSDYHDERTLAVDARFSVTSDSKIVRAIAGGTGPKKSLIAFGYAGWGAGQLDDELNHNDWYVTPANATLLFDLDRDSVWQKAYEQRVLRL